MVGFLVVIGILGIMLVGVVVSQLVSDEKVDAIVEWIIR